MTIEKLDFSSTGSFSNIFLDYLAAKPGLQKFYHRPPVLESFPDQIQEKQLDVRQRILLTEVLQKQYKGNITPSETVSTNIESLKKDKTYTITTGHQLNIFTGPVYFIYKIVTVINLCKKLKEAYPEYHFVPVYWMASEDHDFEEINHFNLFGKTYTWHTNQQGAVGRFHPDGISEILESLPEPVPLFEEAYRSHSNLADATRHFVNELFAKEGLVVLDADDPALKASFRQVIADDLQQHHANKLVGEASEALDNLDYKTQVFPREINFFYLQDQLRERIIQKNDHFQVKNAKFTFSQEKILEELEAHPERFSPNVILRPLYQEMVLPNLAYVGGPSEIAYWLQLKPVFDYYQVPFPILVPRNFALIINKSNNRKLQKIPIQVKDLFLDTETLVKKFVESNAENSISLQEERNALEKVYQHIKEKVIAVDKGLEGFIGAETNKAIKSLSNIEKRLKKSEEKNQETAVKQLRSLKEKLFPEGNLQERKENFLNFYVNNPGFIDELLRHLDPLDFRFNVINEAI